MLQRKCVRIITFSDFDSHAHSLFIELKVLKISEVIKLQQLKLVFEYFNNYLPEDICHYFTPTSKVHTRFTRSSENCLYIGKVNSSFAGLKSLKYQCSVLWNLYMSNDIPLTKNQNLLLNKINNVHTPPQKTFSIYIYHR